MARLLFGLGNPGRDYEQTRHNAGWQVLDLIADHAGERFSATRMFDGLEADAWMGEERVRLVKPLSYMNRCGPVYQRALEVYDLEPEQALILVDDFQLEFGRLRFRAEGSSGGHNGLRSIERALGTRRYPRLKLGIGPAPPGARWVDYVLRGYSVRQREELPEFLHRAETAVGVWAGEGLEAAMNRFNAPPPDPA